MGRGSAALASSGLEAYGPRLVLGRCWPWAIFLGVAFMSPRHGGHSKFTFRRLVSETLMNVWQEVKEIAESITSSEDCDAIILKFNSTCSYSVQCLYAVKVLGFQKINLFTPL